MSWNLVEIEKKITDRLSAAPIASHIQSAYNTIAPGSTVLGDGQKPIIVFRLLSFDDEFAWDSSGSVNMVTAIYEVAVIDARENGFDNIMTVWGLVFGDSCEEGLNPTYGLHNWEITGMDGTYDCRLSAAGGRTEHDVENLVYIRNFRVYATEKQE